MNFSLKKIFIWISIVAIALLLVVVMLWVFNGKSSSTTNTIRAFFGQAVSNIVPTNPDTTNTEAGNTPLQVGGDTAGSSTTPKIFLITPGPVVAATLIEKGIPTTTTARYVTAEDGHVLDLALDVPGAVPHIVSQTTIPGIQRAFFTDHGNGAILQYLQGTTVKTVHLAFQIPAATATSSPQTAPQVLIQFLPDNIEDLAISPDGKQVVYLTHTTTDLDGYIAHSDGAQFKKIFSLALSEVLLSWSAQENIIAYSKSASGVPGIVFSIDIKTGAISPLLYGGGITAIADGTLQNLLYQISDGNTVQTSIDALKTGLITPIAGIASRILPEQCANSSQQLFCAAPLSAPSANFIDQWHQGTASVPDALVRLDLGSGIVTTLATPGTAQGGESSNILGIALSPLGKYASFINKNNGKLWGVRLSQ